MMTGRICVRCLFTQCNIVLKKLYTHSVPALSNANLSAKFGPPDEFGTLEDNPKWKVDLEYAEEDNKDREDHFTPVDKKRWGRRRYERELLQLMKERKLSEALDLFEVRLKEDRVRPTQYMYNLLISACGREGYSKKAAKLYNDLKRRDMKVSGCVYTALFNSYANSPWKEDGLKRARHLRQLMSEKNIEPNELNYLAMIKAFAWHGELETCFEIVDEMSSRMKVRDDQVYNHLYAACIKDKEAGLRHALLIWRLMRKKHIRPTVYSYTLMLQCARLCGVGDKNFVNDLLKISFSEPKQISGKCDKEIERIVENNSEIQQPNELVTIKEEKWKLPILLAWKGRPRTDVQIGDVSTSQKRLGLLGGVEGVLNQMMFDKVKPNVCTFTELLQLIPSDLQAELNLLTTMKNMKVELDVDFFNMFLQKRIFNFDRESKKVVLEHMAENNISPNIATFGVLACACKSLWEAKLFLNDMKQAGFRLSPIILGTLICQACWRSDVRYLKFLMETALRYEVGPDEKALKNIERTFQQLRKLERQRDIEQAVPAWFSTEPYQYAYKEFKDFYPDWLQRVVVDIEPHPWKQFQKHKQTQKMETVASTHQ